MACCKLGATVVGIRGTIGGITFGQNKSGPTCKVWSRSGASHAPYQELCRGQMARWGNVWRALSGPEQGDWDSFAASPPETDYDKFGNVVLRTGFQWLCRLNQRRALLTSVPLSLAPASVVQVQPVITSWSCQVPSSSPGTSVFTHSSTEFAPTDIAVVFVSLVSSTGVRQVRRGFKLITMLLPAGQTSSDITGGMVNRWTWWPQGWQAVLQVYRMTFDGIRSVPAVLSTVVLP